MEYKSADNGLSWTQTSLSNSYAVYSLAASGNNIFAGCHGPGGESVFKSANNGTNWLQHL
jgi:hypothetical protein